MGNHHVAMDLQAEAVYGLTEHYRTAIRDARLVACPGCYPTATLLSLLPLASAGLVVDVSDIVIDAKSGSSRRRARPQAEPPLHRGRRRAVAYFVGKHRHMPEIEHVQGLGRQARQLHPAPHPDEPGELCTSYVRLAGGATADDLRAALDDAYRDEAFVHVAAAGVLPQTQNVRGSSLPPDRRCEGPYPRAAPSSSR